MKIFSSALSREKEWQKAAHSLCAKIKSELEGKSCDLALFFVSESYSSFNPRILSGIFSEQLSCNVLIGCNASGIIGTENEIEMEPAISILAMHLPGVQFYPFSLSALEANSLNKGAELVKKLDFYPTENLHFICLADSMSCNVEGFLKVLNEGYPARPVIGGLASGAALGMPNWLSLNGEIFEEGIVGVGLTGEIKFDVIVSQGCRPIGEPYIITKAEQHVLHELASKPATEVLENVFDQLSVSDKNLAKHSLFVGLVMNEQQQKFKRGDFLIRNILGMDEQRGTLMIGSMLKTGQTLQFQLRDAQTSAEDLKILLGSSSPTAGTQGGILVSCCGRGKGLYGQPNHDVEMIQSMRGPLPLVGFFANGEIGPIGEKNYLHGYTSSLVIIR